MNCFTTPFGGFTPNFGPNNPMFNTPFGGVNCGGFSPIQNGLGVSNVNPFVNTPMNWTNPVNGVSPMNWGGVGSPVNCGPIGGFVNPITGMTPFNFMNPMSGFNTPGGVSPANWTSPVNWTTPINWTGQINPFFSTPTFQNGVNRLFNGAVTPFNTIGNPFINGLGFNSAPWMTGGFPFFGFNSPVTNVPFGTQPNATQNGQPVNEPVNQGAIPFGYQGYFPFATPYTFNGVSPVNGAPFNGTQTPQQQAA